MTLDRKIKWLFGLIVLANVIIVLVVALGAFEPAPPKPMPNPNGYDDFVKAGKMLSGKASSFTTMTQEELAALIATNAEALKLLRAGLSLECREHDDYSRDYLTRLLPELMSLKALALNLCAEGKLAKIQNRTNDAIQSYLDTVRFGEQCGHGSVLFSKLVAVACEGLGYEGLQSLTNGVNSRQCSEIVLTLETVNVQESPTTEILEQEALWMRKGTSLREKIGGLIHYKDEQKQKEVWLTKIQTNQLRRRQLMLDFAARAYELGKGKPPAAITDLVPDYLKAIPKDPITGSNLVLRANAL